MGLNLMGIIIMNVRLMDVGPMGITLMNVRPMDVSADLLGVGIIDVRLMECNHNSVAIIGKLVITTTVEGIQIVLYS